MKKLLIVAFMIVIVALTACSSIDSPSNLSIGDEVLIPTGYTFVDASAYGQYGSYVTYYCIQDRSGGIFECTDGKIGREIIIPEGYFFIGASAYGKYGSYPTYYCGKVGSSAVFICEEQ